MITRIVLAFSILLQAGGLALAGFAGGGIPGLHGGVGAGSQFAPLTVVNTSGSTQAAGGWTAQFGHPFDKGRIPAGTAPVFKDAGATQPYCWGGQTYWSDGSLRYASFIVRLTNSIAGNSSKTIGIFNGGTAPTTSARTLTEVYNQSAQVNLTGAGTDFGLTNNWTAQLANNARNWKQSKFLDGDACAEWKVSAHFVPADGNWAPTSTTPHGQLEADFYVAALTDGSGNLGGFRINYAVHQPWSDVNSPTKGVRAYTTVALQYGAGPTRVNAQQPFTPKAFTWNRAGDVFRTTTSNNWYTGATQNVVPGYVTSPSGGLSGTRLYYARVQSNGDFFLGQNSNGSNPTALGSGSGTFNPVLETLHFQRGPWGVDANGKWLYVQGTGSVAADSTLRNQIDQAYWKTTHVIPPYDLSVLGSVTDNTTPSDYAQSNIFTMDWDTGNVGERDDIGVLPAQTVRYFYTQTALSEKAERILGYAGALFGDDVRDSATGSVLNLTNVAYTGMPASNTAAQWMDGTGVAGFTSPPAAEIYPPGWSGHDWTHRPSLAPAAYLFFGQPDFLDIMVENGAAAGLSRRVQDRYADGTPYSSGYMVLTYWCTAWREMAWSMREWAWAAGLLPKPYYEGGQLWNYFDDTATTSAKWPADVSAVRLNSYSNTNGLWTPVSNQCGVDCYIQTSAWQRAYNIAAFSLHAALREDSNALSLLQNWFAKWYAHIQTIYGGYLNVIYYEHNIRNGDDTHTFSLTQITSDDEWMGIGLGGLGSLAWTNSGTRPFSYPTGANAGTGYTLAADDVIRFDQTVPAGGSYAVETNYYVARSPAPSGLTFALSATLGGGALSAPSDTNAGLVFNNQWSLRPATLPGGATEWRGILGSTSDTADVRGVMNWIKAISGGTSYTTLDAAIADQANRLTAAGVTFTDSQKYFLSGSY